VHKNYFNTLAPLLLVDSVTHVCAVCFGRSSVSHFKIIGSLPQWSTCTYRMLQVSAYCAATVVMTLTKTMNGDLH